MVKERRICECSGRKRNGKGKGNKEKRREESSYKPLCFARERGVVRRCTHQDDGEVEPKSDDSQ